jgi:hypothetical protein
MRRVLREMDAEEFGWWAALYRRDPWGEERADARHGILCSLVANALSGKGKKFKPADFVPKYGPRPKAKKSLYEQFKAITIAAGGEVTERGG